MTLKGFMKDPLLTIANHKFLLLAAYLLSLVIGAFVFSALESRSLVDSIYWAVVSGTSTGFGDVTPHTNAGKIFVSAYLLWTIPVMASLITAFIVEHLRQDPNTFTHAEQEEILAYIRGEEAKRVMASCGGCAGMGAHRRWCKNVVSSRAALLGPLAERADALADTVGSNEPGAANALYAASATLRKAALESG